MDTKTKAKIVSEAWLSTRGIEQWKSVHHYLDIGFPLAFASDNGMATLTKKGSAIIDEAYAVIINSLSLDINKEYESFDDLLDENITNNTEQE